MADEEDPLLEPDEPEGMFLSSGDQAEADIAVIALSPGQTIEVYNEQEEGATLPPTLRLRVTMTTPGTLQITSTP